MEAVPYLPFIEPFLLLMPSFLRQGNGFPYPARHRFPIQHQGGTSPLLILPFFTVVEYDDDISVERVYCNSTVPFHSGNTAPGTIAVFFWMLERFASPSSELQVFQAQYVITPFSYP